MRTIIILPLFTAGALASNDHVVLLGRAIDPKTMDPTQLSVLSVLRTAIPTGSDAPLPTGRIEPEWYQNLPADVKSLLPVLYPAAATAATSASSSESVVSQTSAPVLSSTALESSVLVNSGVVSDASSTASDSASTLLWSSQITITKTLQYAPSGTAGSNSTISPTTGSGNGTRALPTPSSTPSGFFSTGTKTAIGIGTLAAVLWASVGAAFVIFG